jgi:hypothetical protein
LLLELLGSGCVRKRADRGYVTFFGEVRLVGAWLAFLGLPAVLCEILKVL